MSFLTLAPARAENLNLIGDLLSVGARAAGNHHQNRLNDRLRAIEQQLVAQRQPSRSNEPDPEVLADAERDLGLILTTPMDESQRRRLLVSGMTRAKYNDPSLRKSPRFEEIRRNAIHHYMQHFASPKLRELSRAMAQDPADPEVMRLYADSYVTELQTVQATPDLRFPILSDEERREFRARIDSIRAPGAPAPIIDRLKANALGATPEQLDLLERVMAFRRELDGQYPMPERVRTSPADASPASPLVSAQRSFGEVGAIREALAAVREVDVTRAGQPAQATTQRVLHHAVLRGNATVVREIAAAGREYRSWWPLDTIFVGGGAGVGGLTIGGLALAIFRSHQPGLTPLPWGQSLRGAAVAVLIGAVVGGFAGNILESIVASWNGRDDNSRDTRLAQRVSRAGSSLGGWDLRPAAPVRGVPTTPAATPAPAAARTPTAIPPAAAAVTTVTLPGAPGDEDIRIASPGGPP